MASFRAAERAGADQLETDLQLIDGELVLAHPPRQPRASLADLLKETELPLVLHIKRRHWDPRHDRRVLDRLAALDINNPYTVSSFWPGTLTYAKRHYPKLRTAYITFWPAYDLLFWKRLGASEYGGWWRLCSARVAQRYHARGLRLIAFTPDNPSAIRKLRDRGVDGVITNAVSAAVAAVRSRSARGTRQD